MAAEKKLAKALKVTSLKKPGDYFFWGSLWFNISMQKFSLKEKRFALEKALVIFKSVLGDVPETV